MMGTVRIIARPGLAAGLALTGIPVMEASGGAAAADRIRSCVRQGGIAVVLLDEALENALPDDIRRMVACLDVPVVLPIPDPAWERRDLADHYIADLLRRAIGYRIRL